MNLRILLIIGLAAGVVHLYRSEAPKPPGGEATVIGPSGDPVTIAVPPGGLPPEQWKNAIAGRWRDNEGDSLQLLSSGSFSSTIREEVRRDLGVEGGSAPATLNYSAMLRGSWTLQGQQLQLTVKEVPQFSINDLRLGKTDLPSNISYSVIDSALNKVRAEAPKTFTQGFVGRTLNLTIHSVTPQQIDAVTPDGRSATLRRQR